MNEYSAGKRQAAKIRRNARPNFLIIVPMYGAHYSTEIGVLFAPKPLPFEACFLTQPMPEILPFAGDRRDLKQNQKTFLR